MIRIIETAVFTKQIKRLLDDDTYKEFKAYLVCNPLKGTLIKGGGGIRKIRWGKKHTGKSGGVRIIYFIKTETKIYLLFAYAKSDMENITKKQVHVLASLIKGL